MKSRVDFQLKWSGYTVVNVSLLSTGTLLDPSGLYDDEVSSAESLQK